MMETTKIKGSSAADLTAAAKEFGTYLRELRKSHGLNQADLAQRIEVTSGYYGFFEQGRQIPSLKIINRLAEVLGIDYLEMAIKAGYDEFEARKKEMYRAKETSKGDADEQAQQPSQENSLSEAGGVAEVPHEVTDPNSVTPEENGVLDPRGVAQASDQASNSNELLRADSGASNAGLDHPQLDQPQIDQPRIDWAMGCISCDPTYKLADQFRGEISREVKALVIQLYQAQTGRQLLTSGESLALNYTIHG